jgi:hypothetical protein
MEQARENGKFDELKNKMNDFLKRDSDRAIFDLPPLKQIGS